MDAKVTIKVTMEWFMCLLFSQTDDDLNICQAILNDTAEYRKIFFKFQCFVRMTAWWWTNKTFWYKCISKDGKKTGFYTIGNVYVENVKNDNHWAWLLGEFPKQTQQIKTLTRFPVSHSSNVIQRILILIDKAIQTVPIGIWRLLNWGESVDFWKKQKFNRLINYEFVAVIAQLMVCFNSVQKLCIIFFLQLPKSLFNNFPKIIFNGVGRIKWNQPKSLFIKSVMKPDYCYQQMECLRPQIENPTDEQCYIPPEIKWYIIKHYFLPNFNSPTPFGSKHIKTQLWKMRKGIIALLILIYLYFFILALGMMMRTSYYDTKEKETLTTYCLSRLHDTSSDTCDIFKALCPGWAGTHSDKFNRYQNLILNIKRKAWPKVWQQKQTFYWDGQASAYAMYHAMKKAECMIEIEKKWNTLAMMTVCELFVNKTKFFTLCSHPNYCTCGNALRNGKSKVFSRTHIITQNI